MANHVSGTIGSNNTSGICGVHFDKRLNKWRADYKGKYLGEFKNKKDAIACREKAQGFKYKEPAKKHDKRDITALRKFEAMKEEKELKSLDDY